MSELETLKDICWENKIGLKGYMNFKALAMKWIKEIRETLKEGLFIDRADKIIMKMNDIKEEDLKNE